PRLNQLALPRKPPLQVDTDAPSISGRILAFMERMAMVYLRSSSVWTHVLTFVLLHSLLRHAFEKDVDAQGGHSIVALLRILRANFQPLSSVLSTDLAVPLGVPPASVGLGMSDDSSSLAQRLHAVLTNLSTVDLDSIDEDMLKLIHHEATQTQVAGTEIFYPTTQKRAEHVIQSLDCRHHEEDTDALCRFLVSRRHLVMQFLPHPELNLHAELFPWTVEDVQSSLLDLKKPITSDEVLAVLGRFQSEGTIRGSSPEQLVVLYEAWHLYYRDNHCQLSAATFKQLWHALVHHVPTPAVVELSPRPQESSLVQLVALLQTQVVQHLLPVDTWDVATTSRLQQWHAPRRYFKVVNCPIGVRTSPNVKASKLGRTLNIGQMIESSHVLRKPDDAVLYVAHGDGWVFDVDPSDGMVLLEEQGSGIYTWRIQVIKCANVGQILLGLSTKSSCTALTALCIGTTVDSFGWMLTGDFYHCGQRSQHTSTLPLFSSKSIPLLDLIVNTTANTLVVCNANTGVPYGPAYALELAAGAEYFPAVSLFRRHDCVAWKSAILFPSEWSLTQQQQQQGYVVPAVVPTSMALSCAKEVLGVFREATHHDNNDAVRMRWLGPMVAQFAANMCLWTSMLDERDYLIDLIEDILLHRQSTAITDDMLTLACLAGQLYGDMIVGEDVDALAAEAGPEHKWIQSKLFHGGVHKRTEKNVFLKQFMDGHWSSLDKTMLRFVGGSALVLRMGGPALDRAIRGVVATMLLHCGMTVSAECVDVDSLKMPPKSLRLIWQKAVELKSWALRYKTSANTTYDEIATMLTSKVDLLLSLTPCKSDEYVGDPPSLSRRISMGSSKRSGSFDATPEDAVFPSWEPELLQAIYNFYRDVDCNVNKVQEMLSLSQQKAITRASGLRRVTNVLHVATVAVPAKAAILVHLMRVLRRNPSSLWHYQQGIDGCPAATKRDVHVAFEGFYYCITQLLSNGCNDVSWQFVLLDTSALRILPEDHVMLASCRVFQTLQEILDRTTESPSLLGLRQAAMKVVYLLALQVASDGGAELDPTTNPTINSLSPPHFQRQLSGPQTLSANVFDMLYSEMYVVVHSMLEDADMVYNMDTIGPNPRILGVLSLLQFVSTSSVCQTFLCTPNWLSLFVTTACFGQVEPQTRAMQLLHTLLPLCDPSFVAIDLPFDLTTMACVVGTSVRARPLVEFFLANVGRALSPLDATTTDQLPRSVESCLSLGSESVSMLRMLIGNDTWTDLVAQCLTDSYSSQAASHQLGVLGVMGSFAEPLRFGGHVELVDCGTQATIVSVNNQTTIEIQKRNQTSICQVQVEAVTAVPRVAISIAAFPPALVESVLRQTALLVDSSALFLAHFQVARWIYNEEPARVVTLVSEHPSVALKVFEIGATLTDTNGLPSLAQLEDKLELIRRALYATTYGSIRNALYPVSEANAPLHQPPDVSIHLSCDTRLGFAEGLVCTMKQVSTFDVPVDIDPNAIAWLEALLNHVLSLTVAELMQTWATATDLTRIELRHVQQAVETVYGRIQLPEMLQAACAEANEWLSNRDHWGKEWTVHEASIVQYVLRLLAQYVQMIGRGFICIVSSYMYSCRNNSSVSMDKWRDKCAALKVGSYLCATCECLVADVLSLSMEVLRNAEAATPVITLASILEAMQGDDELGRLLVYHKSYVALQSIATNFPTLATSSPPVVASKTSDEKVLDVRIQSMIAMGFPEQWCKRALDESGQDVNAALNWILINGELLQDTSAAQPFPMSNDNSPEPAVAVDDPPPPPSLEWSTATSLDVAGPYVTYWKLGHGNTLAFTIQSRTGTALVGLFCSRVLHYELRISDKAIDLSFDGHVVCTELGAFCDDVTGVSFWAVWTPTTLYIGQGPRVHLDALVLQWTRTDNALALDSFSFGSTPSTVTLAVSAISWTHVFASDRSLTAAPIDTVVWPTYTPATHDLTACFYDRPSSSFQPTTDQFNVWGLYLTRQGFQDAMHQESAPALLQHANEMVHVLRILYARRLGLTILAVCNQLSALEPVFRDHEPLFVEFVSLVSNRHWISDMTKIPTQTLVGPPWYLPRKQTSLDFVRPAMQSVCACLNPLSTAVCAYLQSHMTAFLLQPASLHWTEPSSLKTDVAVRQGSDLRFLLLVTQWLLPVSNNVMERALFGIWATSLTSNHVHVKQTAFQVLSRMLHQCMTRVNESTTDKDDDLVSLFSYTKLVSYPHLKMLTARLLQHEQENCPMYSQYFQAVVDFLALYERALHRLDQQASTETAPSNTRGLFFKGGASYVDIKGDDISPPWTAQYTVHPVAGGAVAVLATSTSTAILLRCGQSFNARHPSLALKTKANAKVIPFHCHLPNDTWSVLTITASSSQVSVYINGTLAAKADVSDVRLPMGQLGDPSQGFRGWLANVRYFDSILTSSQISSLVALDRLQFEQPSNAASALLTPPSPLDSVFPALTAIAHWPLNEGVGAVVHDALRKYADVAVHGAKWSRLELPSVDKVLLATSHIAMALDAEYLQKYLVFSGTGTFTQQPCGALGGGTWNASSTKALAVHLYSLDRSSLEGMIVLNSTLRWLVTGTTREDGFVEFSVQSRRGNGESVDDTQWMDGVVFQGWHRHGVLKGTWRTSLTQTIPPRHDCAMYFLAPTTDSVVLSDGGRMALSVLRKSKKKANVLYMGFGYQGLQQAWASNGCLCTSDLPNTAQHDILNRTDGFATIRCHALVRRGQVYFEMTLKSSGLMQLGFVSAGFKPAFATHGVGDHFGSFAVDGKRRKKWCNTGSSYGGDWSWSAGDVVGAMIDFEAGTMGFTHHGVDLGVAFTQNEYPQVNWTNGLYPAGSFSSGEGAWFNLGQSPFQYQPPRGYISVLESVNATSLKNEAVSLPRVDVYSHRQKRFSPISTGHRVTETLSCPFPTHRSLSYGVYHWEVLIQSLTATDGIRVGVCIERVNSSLLLGEDRFGWGLCSSGKIYHGNTALRYASVGFVQGDRVGIELNMIKGTLAFYRNRTALGDAFTNLHMELPMQAFVHVNNQGGFVPAVSLFRPQSMVVALGLKHGQDEVEYPKTYQVFCGTWKQGQRDGDGTLHVKRKSQSGGGGGGFYMGTYVDNELHGAALWCEQPVPACVSTLYPSVWKSLGFERSARHLVCGVRSDVFYKGDVVETGSTLPLDKVVPVPTPPPSLNPAKVQDGWYSSVRTSLRFARRERPHEAPTTTRIFSLDGTWLADKHQRFVLIPPSHDTAILSSDLTSGKLEPHASAGNHVLFRGNIGISSGVHYWEVGVQACNHGSLFVGIASSQITPSEGWGDFGFVSYRVRWSQAEGEHLYGRYFSAGDTIGVRFDMEQGTLSFTKDGDDFTKGRPAVIHMGVAFRHLRTQLASHNLTFVPVVGCSHPGDAFTVKGYKWHSQDTSPQWPIARLDQVLEASKVVLDEFPSPIVMEQAAQMYHTFISRGEFTPKRFWSRGGILVELTTTDLDKAITRLHGIDRFSLRHGEAIVLGEKDGVVWYVIQGNEAAGAWYWTDPEVAHLLTLNPSEVAADPWSCAACTMLNDPNLSKCQICDTPRETDVDDADDVDGNDDDMTAGQPLIVLQAWSDIWNRVAPLVDMDEDQAARRLSVLLAWNSRVQLLLPFLDFHGQHLLESPISRTANRLTHLRHLIFKRHKIKFWRDMVDITTTHTTPPSDEYERPDSLREVSVNRIVALDEPVSFATSVFGQLHEAMQAWDNHSLRRAYADELQDAGQRRAFYVKFLGEGVDDHGGPYRAVFQTGAWDEPSGGLQEISKWIISVNPRHLFYFGRVFIPCPNAVTAGGMNQDKFVVSGTASHLKFLGKLIGMATRHRIMVPLNLSDLFWKPLVGLPNDRKDLGAVDTMLMRELHDLECLGDAEVEALDPDEVVEYLLRVTQAPRNPHMDKMNTLTVPMLAQLVDDSVALKLDAIRLQLVSFMEGMAAVLPYALCTLFTPAQFEELVCGSPDIDIDMLQRITVYEGVDATAPHIGFFWQCLQDMNQAQRSLFVNFVLARSRLPSSKDICMEKLLYAINNSPTMDADFVERGSAGWEHMT
ncbi:hypothetical protein DYB37_006851, partial [Aphanomyces astaci]